MYAAVSSHIKADDTLRNTPVININNCCAGQGRLDYETLATNFSVTLSEHNEKMENMMRIVTENSIIRDCQDILSLGNRKTGTYIIYPKGTLGFPVRCDMDTTTGGWTVFQRRVSKSDFYKNWTEYQTGFGNLSENFWLGNQQLHMITSQGWYELRVDLTSMGNIVAYAEYNVFAVGDVDSGYKLTVDGYSGNAGDSLHHHNGRKFSAVDRDNDDYKGHCAVLYTGPWWHGLCHDSNLNGMYGTLGGKGPVWETFKGNDGPMKKTEMKIRRWKPHD